MKKEQELAKYIFNKINDAASSIEKLKEIENDDKISKYKMKDVDFERINFSIEAEEITELINNGILNKEDYTFNKDINYKITDPLTKLLYAIAWKNGDLKKIKHIIKGICDEDKAIDKQEEALTFFQFGKYLTKQGEPIIDQHVIRAFVFHKEIEDKEMQEFKTLDSLNKKHKERINEYIKWLTDKKKESKFPEDYAYYVDKILFATGKAIKKM